MGLDSVKNGVHGCKNLVSSMKNRSLSLCDHPFIFSLVLILIILYRFLPSILTFFISSSPILVCTAVLLRALLCFRSPEVSRIESKRTVKARVIDNDAIVNKDESSSADTRARKKWDIKDKKAGTSSDRKVTFSKNKSSKSQKKKTQKDNLESQQSASNSIHDAPRDEIVSVLDDMRPLLNSQPLPSDEFELASGDSERSIDGSADSDEDENHEEEDGQVGEKVANKSVVSWTEDDQKNLMDLGTSELERNQRLENLIAKRRARLSFGRLPEKNLIDLDSTDPQIQIPSISTIKTNPFDLPFESNEVEGLPPIPGSAPSILAPRRNPFDLPYDPLEERPNLTGDSFHQEFTAILQKDMYCRHESFSLGSSFTAVPRHGHYFASEGMPPYPTFNGRLGEESKYKLPSVSETELVSSIGAHQEGPTKPIEEKMTQQGELQSCVNNYSDCVEPEKLTSEPVHSLEGSSADNGRAEKDLNFANNTSEAHMKSEEAKKKQSAQHSQMPNNMNNNDNQPKKSDSKEITGNAMKLNSFKVKTRAAEGINEDDEPEEPLYDSSPSEIEKRTIEESLFCMDKEVALHCTSSIASDLQVEVYEIGSPKVERTISFTDPVATLNGNGKTETGSGNNNAIEEDYKKSTEAIKIIKCDDAKDGFSGTKHDYMEQEPSAAKQVLMGSESDTFPENQSREQEATNQISSSTTS